MLEGGSRADSYRDIAAAAGMSEGAVKVAAHRLRSRYRELLREEVGRTVVDLADIDAELGRSDHLAVPLNQPVSDRLHPHVEPFVSIESRRRKGVEQAP